MAHLYYDETLSPTDLRVGETVVIAGDEGRHAVRVSRLRVGENVLVGNGSGVVAQGSVTTTDRDRFAMLVESVSQISALATQLFLVQALAKGDRDERAIEQSTEFGVDGVLPWEAERSVSRWGTEKAVRGVEKWQRIAREAAKQSIRAWVPQVVHPHRVADLTQLAAKPENAVLVLHPRGAQRLSEWSSSELTSEIRNVYLVVGPEGGISDGELQAFETAGCSIVQLGDMVLRTSSAGPAALAVLNVSMGRW